MDSIVVVTSWWSNCLALACLHRLAEFAPRRKRVVVQAGKSAAQMERFRAWLPPGTEELPYPPHLPTDDSPMREYLARDALRDFTGAWFFDHDALLRAPAEDWFAAADALFDRTGICLSTAVPREGPGLTQPAYWMSPRRLPPDVPSFDPVPFRAKTYTRRPDLCRLDGRRLAIPEKDTLVRVAEHLAALGLAGTFPLDGETARAHALPAFPPHLHLGGIHLYTGPVLPPRFADWMRLVVSSFDRFFAECPKEWLEAEEPELLRRHREFKAALHAGLES